MVIGQAMRHVPATEREPLMVREACLAAGRLTMTNKARSWFDKLTMSGQAPLVLSLSKDERC
jgi:hypothetical protein